MRIAWSSLKKARSRRLVRTMSCWTRKVSFTGLWKCNKRCPGLRQLADSCIAGLEDEMNGTSSATSTPLPEAGQVRYLDSKKLRFAKHGACLRLTLEDEISYLDVEIIRLFPLSD